MLPNPILFPKFMQIVILELELHLLACLNLPVLDFISKYFTEEPLNKETSHF